jgi:hypothetical protein
MIKRRQKKYSEDLHTSISNKIINERKKFNLSLERFMTKKKEDAIRSKEKELKRFQSFVSFIKF